MGLVLDMDRRLAELWYGERAAAALRPFAWLYGAATQLRSRAYARGWLRSFQMACPVIVVGNLTVGGTGKTPLVIWLAEQLTGRGFKVGVVSRGFGRRAHERAPRLVRADSSWEQVGDEPLLIQRRTGCLTAVAADRVAAARALVAQHVDIIVSDDGLQHLRLARDSEIVVVDGKRGFGNGHLLPAGPLREPLEALRRADLIIVNGTAAHGSIARLASAQAPVLGMRLIAGEACRVDGRAPALPLASFAGCRVHAVAAVGHPARFFGELRAHGIEVLEHAFPDHHPFTPVELAFAEDELPILMTEKDAVRCAAWASARMLYVPASADLAAGDARTLLDHVCGKIAIRSATR